MKIATFNINNVIRRLPNLLDWLRAAARRRLPAGAEGDRRRVPRSRDREAGYGAVWRGQKTWNGVAILAATPILVRGRAARRSRPTRRAATSRPPSTAC